MTTIKFIIGSRAFSDALQKVTPVVAGNPVVPILENTLITVTGSVVGQAATMRLLCSNLETELSIDLPVECRENFAAAVPAKKLLTLLKGFPDAPVTCTWNPENYAFELAVGRGKYKVAGENPADFPKPRKQAAVALLVRMPTPALRAALTATLTLCGTDNNRAAMTAVLVEATALDLRFVGCDGHRVGYWESTDNTEDGSEWSNPGSFLIPRLAAALLLAQLDPKSTADVTLSADATNVRTADGRWITRLVDERYPDYRNVIPPASSNANVAVVDRDELLTTVRRLEQLANEKTKQIRLSFAGHELTAAAEDLDFSSEGSEVLGCDYTGEPMEIGFNATYLTQTLGLLPAGRVRVAMSTPTRAATMTAGDDHAAAPALLYLVMPVQLNQYV